MKYNWEDAKEYIRRNVDCRQFLTKARHGGYCCPVCGSGDGPNGSGALKYYQDSNDCACFAEGNGDLQAARHDIFEIYGAQNGISFAQAVEDLAGIAGIEIERSSGGDELLGWDSELAFERRPHGAPTAPMNGSPAAASAPDPKQDPVTLSASGFPQAGPAPAAEVKAGSADYSLYYDECTLNLFNQVFPESGSEGPAAVYLRQRGIDPEKAIRMGIGFDPAADPANAPGVLKNQQVQKKYPTPRIIIPTGKAHYVARSIDPNTTKGLKALNPAGKMGGGSPGLFRCSMEGNPEDLVFITEGWADAMSLLEIGYDAIALNSTSNTGLLIKEYEAHRPPQSLTVCLALDEDPAGQKATTELQDELRRLSIPFVLADICCGRKDANEALVADREGFRAAVAAVEKQCAPKPDSIALYLDTLMQDEIDRFRADVKTGFPVLDDKDHAGGLYAGLYVLAAISSLGKTTFALQMADQIAQAGHDVLFFSMEQSRLEMASKCIARRTFENDPDDAMTSLSIRRGCKSIALSTAARQFADEVGDRLSIIESNFDCTPAFIGDYVRTYIRKNGSRPVVFVDYLQVLQPETVNGRQQTTKEVVDLTTTQLRRLSREMGLTIIAICSVNRANYLTPVGFESLKESGNIEYTADVVWGLQLACLTEDEVFRQENKLAQKREAVAAAKKEYPRQVQLVCLKNRFGIASYSCRYKYFSAFDCFQEIIEQPKAADAFAVFKAGK